MCEVLGVSRSGYYAWVKRVTSPLTGRAAADAVLLEQIRAIHTDFAFYGAPRVHRELRALNCWVGRHRVARLMRQHGIRARRGQVKGRPRSAPPKRAVHVRDLVRRDFSATGPNRLWLTDITLVPTSQGRLRAAVILDAYNREVIAWAVDERERPTTALRALTQAIRLRCPAPGCVIHSDRGYQFTAHDWLGTAAAAGLSASIGQRHSALDNAMMESWFASFKNEALYPYPGLSTFGQARTLLLRYIHLYNTRRLHSALGYLTPIQYASING
jgi:putative transposase